MVFSGVIKPEPWGLIRYPGQFSGLRRTDILTFLRGRYEFTDQREMVIASYVALSTYREYIIKESEVIMVDLFNDI